LGICTNHFTDSLKPIYKAPTEEAAKLARKYCYTTLEAINATGVLRAVIDNPSTGHVSVFATNPAEQKAWIASGDNRLSAPYYLTIILQGLMKRGM
jgi:hypothetical protein